LPVSRQTSILAYERGFAADTVSLGHEDYSFKPVKSIIDYDAQTYYATALATTVPFFYGAQPNLGLYYRPDGPHPNPADLLPLGKIDEAQAAQVTAAEHLKEDIRLKFRKSRCIQTSGWGSAGFPCVLKPPLIVSPGQRKHLS
jgi:dimethylamine--corrinoid protein Co-methyltransferase